MNTTTREQDDHRGDIQLELTKALSTHGNTPDHLMHVAMRVPELAKQLDLSISQVYKLVERGSIPHYRLGAALRFDPLEIRTWLEQFHHKAGTPQSCEGEERPKASSEKTV